MGVSLKQIFRRFRHSPTPIVEKALDVVVKPTEQASPKTIERYVILERYKYFVKRGNEGIWSEFTSWDIRHFGGSRLYHDKSTAEHALMQISSKGHSVNWIVENKIVKVKLIT